MPHQIAFRNPHICKKVKKGGARNNVQLSTSPPSHHTPQTSEELPTLRANMTLLAKCSQFGLQVCISMRSDRCGCSWNHRHWISFLWSLLPSATKFYCHLSIRWLLCMHKALRFIKMFFNYLLLIRRIPSSSLKSSRNFILDAMTQKT